MFLERRSFAYSLSQAEDGWRWRIYDEDGETVAQGADICRAVAQAAVDALLRTDSPWGEASASAA